MAISTEDAAPNRSAVRSSQDVVGGFCPALLGMEVDADCCTVLSDVLPPPTRVKECAKRSQVAFLCLTVERPGPGIFIERVQRDGPTSASVLTCDVPGWGS